MKLDEEIRRKLNLKPVNDRLIEKNCPKCNHKHMWTNRTGINTMYKYKCCKCGFIEK